jgi:amino-acid N-acetyltransferase
MELNIRKAQQNDFRAIIHLLASNQLPTVDIYEKNITLFVGLLNNEIIATIGMENYGTVALLRSLCVKEGFKNKKYGEKMLSYLRTFCTQEKTEALYLLTTTAEHYFERYGFEKIVRNAAPLPIQTTREFQSICPNSAVVMKLKCSPLLFISQK